MFALCSRIGYDNSSANQIDDIYNAVKKTKNASYMRDPKTPKIGGGGFVFCEDPELDEIKKELKIRDGSGTSLALGLRSVQHFLKNYEDFVFVNFTYFQKSNEKTLHDLKEDFKLQLLKDLML
jgi:hypothetical protein